MTSPKNGPCTTHASLSLCGQERNLVEVSIAVGQSGDRPKEPPRRLVCRGGKRFGQVLPTHRRKPKGSFRRRKFQPKPSRTSILAVLDDSNSAGSLGAQVPIVLMIVGLFDGE